MVVLDSNNRHAAASRKALEYLKELSASLDGWEFSQEKDSVKLYSKAVPDSPIPIVRGDIILKTDKFTPWDVAVVATQPGCRKICKSIYRQPLSIAKLTYRSGDEKFDVSEVKEVFTCFESLFWVKLKAPWPISPRDFAGVALRDMDRELCYVSMSSVEDAAIPPVSGCVRGNLIVSGWKLGKVPEGVSITYITRVDLAGSIPSSFLKTVQQQIPLCAGKVAEYVQSYGFPPAIVHTTATYSPESFDHGKREFSVTVDKAPNVDASEAKWLTSFQMYPNGINVSLSSDDATFEIVDAEHGNKWVHVKNITGPTTVKISKA